jgi:ketosteroid isomerase-like protein
MPAPDLDTAQQFQSAAEDGMRTGDFAPLAAILAPDVEVVMPQHSVSGPDAAVEELSRARPSERFDLEFEDDGWKDLGGGRYSLEIRVHFRSKVSDELSYSRDRSFVLTIGDGKVSRLEMRFAG